MMYERTRPWPLSRAELRNPNTDSDPSPARLALYALPSDLRGIRRAGPRRQPGAGLSPAHRRHADARHAPSARSRKATGRSSSRASSAANGWAATASSAPARSCASRRSATASRFRPPPAGPAASRAGAPRPAAAAGREAGRLPRPARARPAALLRRRRRLRRLRRRALRRDVCRIRRPTTATCPTCASPSTTAWSSSTTSTRPSPSSPTPTSIRPTCARSYRDGLRPRGSAGGALAAGRRRLAADRHRSRSARCSCRISSNFEPDAFEAAVEKCKEYIKAGDIFQVVLSQRLQTETQARPFDIYRTLRVVNPSPFLFYLQGGAAVPGRQLAGDHGARRGRQA